MNHPTTTNQQTDPLRPSDSSSPDQKAESRSRELDETLRDWAACFQLENEGKLSEYCGKYVVIFEGKIIASGNDSEKLRQEMSEKLSLDPNRLVVYFAEPGDYPLPRG